jgi:hypothetical protein
MAIVFTSVDDDLGVDNGVLCLACIFCGRAMIPSPKGV